MVGESPIAFLVSSLRGGREDSPLGAVLILLTVSIDALADEPTADQNTNKPVAADSLTGIWTTDFGKLTLVLDGQLVSGFSERSKSSVDRLCFAWGNILAVRRPCIPKFFGDVGSIRFVR